MKILFTSCIILLSFVLQIYGQKNIVFLVGERYHSTSQTMPALAVALEDQLNLKTYYINIPKNGSAENIQLIEKADLLICYLHLRNLPANQVSFINKHIENGKAVIAFNSTSQAFEQQPEWFAKYFGGGFRGHVKESNKSIVSVIPKQVNHPIFSNLEEFSFQTKQATSIPGPLDKNATVLLMGKSGSSPSFPVAWCLKRKANDKIFYTSLGTASDFTNPTFNKMIFNTVKWALSDQISDKIEIDKYPPPPELSPHPKAVILFNSKDLNQWRHWDLLQHPHSIKVDEQIQKYSNISNDIKPQWKVKKGVIITEPGKGDLITKRSYGNYLLNVDFLIPEEPDYIKQETRGTGGVSISGRYEIRINAGKHRSSTGPNSIFGLRPPDYEMDMKPGVWHNMKIRYKHLNKGPADISVIINGKTMHSDIKLKKPSPYGIIEPINRQNPDDISLHTIDKTFTDEKMKMGENNFSVATRFKTTSSSGTIFARTSEITGWERDGKAFFIGNGKIYYDIGWKSIIQTNRKINDGEWHHAVLTNTKDMCIMYVDGEVTFMKKNFNSPDPKGHVFKIGYAFKNFYNPFDGEISNVRYFDRSLTYKEVMELSEQNTCPENPVLDWKPKAVKKTNIIAVDKSTILKGPIRLHGDFSRIRYANIWLKEN